LELSSLPVITNYLSCPNWRFPWEVWRVLTE